MFVLESQTAGLGPHFHLTRHARRTAPSADKIIYPSYRADLLKKNQSAAQFLREPSKFLASSFTMVKPLSFKGDRKSRKRKAPNAEDETSRSTPENALIVAEEAHESNEDDSWVTAEASSDITGPVIFALPSTPPACIACDANGKVFTIELENMVDGNIATAEPHDVRQVWVANRVAGTENISFKGHQQRYVRPVRRSHEQ